MRSLIVAVTILALLLTFAAVNSHVVTRKADELTALAQRTVADPSFANYDGLIGAWEECEPFFSLTVHAERLRDCRRALGELAYSVARDEAEVKRAAAQFIRALCDVANREIPVFEQIF